MSGYEQAARQLAGLEAADTGLEFLEMRAFIETRLERPLEENVALGLFQVQSKLRDLQTLLDGAMDRNELSAEGYADRFSDLMRASMLESRAVLGPADFVRVYGENGLDVEGMVDKDHFLAEQSFAGSAATSASC